VVASVYGTDFDNRALRGPPEGITSDSSQDSDDDDDDDAPDAVIAAEPIRPIDLQHTLFIRTDIVAACAADIDTHALRGPPSLASGSSDVRDHERLFHALHDGHPFYCASGGQSLRAPP